MSQRERLPNRCGESLVERARSVPIERIVEKRGIKLRRNGCEHDGPCPVCGGTDRFSINVRKQVWNCRGCEKGGDSIALVQHLDGCDFKKAVSALAGEPPPKAEVNGEDGDAAAKRIVVAEFSYHDESGALAFVVERIQYQKADNTFVTTKEGKPKKTFRQKRPDPDKPERMIFNVDGVPPLLYRLPELQEALGNEHTILIPEGETKVDLLWSWNVPATCCATGANKWKPEHSEYLHDADVVLIPDNDDVGFKHVQTIRRVFVRYCQAHSRPGVTRSAAEG